MSKENLKAQLLDKDYLEQVVHLEDLAFKGEGEDAFTIAMIGIVGWILGTVPEDVNELIGAIELVPTKEPGVGFIHGAIVHPEWQFQGIGDFLLKELEKEAINEGLTKLVCTISPTNGASLNMFLNKNGFTATEFHFDYYGEGEHRLWVEKDLSSNSAGFQESQWQAVFKLNPGGLTSVEEDDYQKIATLLNEQNYQAIGVVRPKYSGHHKNLLVLDKGA